MIGSVPLYSTFIKFIEDIRNIYAIKKDVNGDKKGPRPALNPPDETLYNALKTDLGWLRWIGGG